MRALFTAIACIMVFATASMAAQTPQDVQHPQFVVVSFDTTPTEPFEQWHLYPLYTALKAAKPASHDGPDARFTAFLNTGLLQISFRWQPPDGSPWAEDDGWKRFLPSGKGFACSAIRHAYSPEHILESVQAIKDAHAAGIEMGGHSVTHARGRDWSVAQWEADFAEFQRVLTLFELPTPRGFRAPFLSPTPTTGRARATSPLYQVMNQYKMTYDPSKV